MKQKKGSKIWILFALLLVLLVASTWLAQSRYHIFADRQNESVNPQVAISQIPLFSDGSEKSTSGTVTLNLPQGESRSFEILVENTSSTDYNHVTVSKGDMVSSSGSVFPVANIDENIVHAWPQKLVTWGSPNTFTPQAVKVDELLVKNDSPALTPPTDAKYNGDTFFSNDIGILPEQLLKKSGDSANETSTEIKTSLTAGASKKFFFNIDAPANLSGTFSGEISLIDRNSNTVIAKFNLSLNVSDMHLTEATGLTNGCYINDRIAVSPSVGSAPSNVAHYYMSDSLFRQRIVTAKKYGCNSPIIRVGEYSDYNAMAQAITESGMTGPIILNFYGINNDAVNYDDTVSSTTSADKLRSIITDINNNQSITNNIVFYGIDEPNSDEKLPLHQEKVRNIKAIVSSIITDPNSKIKNDVTTSATATTWDTLNNDEMYRSNYPIDHFSSSVFMTDRIAAIKNGTYTPKSNESFYYQGWNEIEKADGSYQPINRFLSGIGLNISGLHGSYVNPTYGYHGISDEYKPYYDDYMGANSNVWQKPMFTFYPASDGLIATLQAESMKQGVADLKYYAKYQALKSGPIPDAKKQALDQLSAQIEANLALYQFSTNNYTLPSGLTAQKMDDTANLMLQYISAYYQQETPPPANSPTISSLNLKDNQVVTTNPYLISAKVENPSSISKVEFYVDDVLIGTATLPDVEGNFTAVWDTSKYHSTIKVVAYDASGNSSTALRNTTVQLNGDNSNSIVPILPKTGEETWWNKLIKYILKAF